MLLQYLLGFRHLGCEVLVVDRLEPEMCIDDRDENCALKDLIYLRYLLDVNHPGFRAHLPNWKVSAMPMKYDVETRAKAVRLVTERSEDYASEYEAIKTVAGRLGVNPETLRKWIRQAEIDAGEREGTTTATVREVRQLKRKNAELEQTIEIVEPDFRSW